jgi:hypothetical protein
VIDQLSGRDPNPAFVATVTETLRQAGYAVDYVPAEQVTVDFFRGLPTRHYDLLVLRVHSSLTGTGQWATGDASIFTNEPYSETKHAYEQTARRLSIVSYYEGSPEYFGITPQFVRSSIRGEFEDAVVIVMGCDALKSEALAEAWVGRGASAFVSWNGPVSGGHSDLATELLVQHLIVDRLALGDALAETTAQVGPDPAYGSTLSFYPREAVASGP